MEFNDGGLGDIFDDDDSGANAGNLEEVMKHLHHLMTEHDMPPSFALEGLLNILKPGATDMSTDILHQFKVAMYVQGPEFEFVADKCGVLWLSTFPWGLGFHFGFEHGFATEQMSFEARRAVIRALCAILKAGGINAVMTDKDRIKVTRKNGEEQDIDIDKVVNQFRNEIESELGPDAAPDPSEEVKEIGDWMKRWMTPDDDE